MAQARTIYDKIWDDHLVHEGDDGTCLIYVDRHLVHEVTSPQAFEGLKLAGRKVRSPEKTLAVVDHNVPTTDRSHGIDDPEAALQVATLASNCSEFGVEYFDELDPRQGVVHIIGPEQGFTLPGTTIVCGDSHTSTHGAFGGSGPWYRDVRSRACAGHANADPVQSQKHAGHRRRGAAGRCQRQGYYPGHHRRGWHCRGEPVMSSNMPARAIRALSMEGRMTICNMSIEGGARAGLIAPDGKDL